MKYCFVFILNVITLFYGSASIAEEIQNPSRWIGVVDATNKTFGWPGSGISLSFNGSSLSVSLKDSGKNSLIVSDGERSFRLNLKSGTHTYELVTNLPMGAHVVDITRRTEGLFGDTEFVSAATDGAFVPAAEPQRRLLIIGDSISAGYGIEGANAQCPFSADTENQYLTYGAIAGRRNHADVTTIAVSGIGVSRNFGGQATPTMPQMMDRPSPNRAKANPDQLRAPPVYQAIVINLGTNDFSQGSRPAGFVADYTALLKKLRQQQPTAMIYAALGPMLAEADFHAAEQAIQQAVTIRQADGDHALASLRLKNQQTGGTGCNWHPNVAAHAAMADILSETLQHDLGWNAP
ncbi:SGNH/GDSL hydrolase family protein [Rhizobium sp.]|jgi:lysophospholipase L1-like esterase|uniref:SGNH/GDSL hydrolase family protein n=1 Tax=Rhizobium sp. TaxID=391 RepID=UPI000E850EA8|nr:hypothetical protein [Rhizobium sp.]